MNKSVNKGFIGIFVFTLNIPGVLLGYAMAYQNQVSPCFNIKFNWNDESTANKWESYLGSSVTLGMTIGAVGGGLLMKIGRRRAILYCCILGMIANGITIVPLNIWAILIGRFLFGLSVGFFSSICPRFIEETVPNHLYDAFAPFFNFS